LLKFENSLIELTQHGSTKYIPINEYDVKIMLNCDVYGATFFGRSIVRKV